RDLRHFSARQRMPTEGQPHHPQVTAASDGSLIAAWDESAQGTRRVAVARGTIGADGRVSFRREVMSGSERATYPAVQPVSTGVAVAWTEGAPNASVIRVTI